MVDRADTGVTRKKKSARGVLVVFAAMIAGIAFGHFFPSFRFELALGGKLFMTLMQMCALPLIVLSFLSAPRRLFGEGGGKSIWPGLSILGTFALSVGMGGAAGLAVGLLARPGSGLDEAALASFDHFSADAGNVDALAAASEVDLFAFFTKIVPENIFAALSVGDIMSVMFFCILAGTALTRVGVSSRKVAFSLLDEAEAALMGLLNWCLKLLPLGLFCLAGGQNYSVDPAMLDSLELFFLAYAACLAALGCVYLLVFARAVGKGLFASLGDIIRPALVAFSTQSSLACLPVIRDSLKKQEGLDQDRAALSAALSITVNPSGSAAFFAVTGVFLAQMYGLEVTMKPAVIIFFGAIFGGMAAVVLPSVVALGLVGVIAEPLFLPHTAVVFLLTGIYPLIDAAMTTINVVANLAMSALIGRATPGKGGGG